MLACFVYETYHGIAYTRKPCAKASAEQARKMCDVRVLHVCMYTICTNIHISFAKTKRQARTIGGWQQWWLAQWFFGEIGQSLRSVGVGDKRDDGRRRRRRVVYGGGSWLARVRSLGRLVSASMHVSSANSWAHVCFLFMFCIRLAFGSLASSSIAAASPPPPFGWFIRFVPPTHATASGVWLPRTERAVVVV